MCIDPRRPFLWLVLAISGIVFLTLTFRHAALGLDIPRYEHVHLLDSMIGEAINHAVVQIQQSPLSRDRWMQLGMVYESNGLPELAERCYHRAASLGPPDAKVLQRLALMQYVNWQLEDALLNMQQARQLNSAYAPLYWRPGYWLLEAGRLDESEAHFRAALTIDSRDTAARLGLVQTLLAQGRANETLALLDHPVENSRYLEYGQVLLRQAYLQLNRHEDAALLAAYASPEPAWSDPWGEEAQTFRTGRAAALNWAQWQIERGMFQNALAGLDHALRHHPNDAEFHNSRAMALIGLGRLSDAIASFERAALLQPDSDAVWLNVARAHLEAGQLSHAETAIARAAAINPHSSDAQELLAAVDSARTALRSRRR